MNIRDFVMHIGKGTVSIGMLPASLFASVVFLTVNITRIIEFPDFASGQWLYRNLYATNNEY